MLRQLYHRFARRPSCEGRELKFAGLFSVAGHKRRPSCEGRELKFQWGGLVSRCLGSPLIRGCELKYERDNTRKNRCVTLMRGVS